MVAKVMEIRFRLCATSERIHSFRDHAVTTIQEKPDFSGQLRWSSAISSADSVALSNQWKWRNTGTEFLDPQCVDLTLSFLDRRGTTLNPDRLESIGNDVLTGLRHAAGGEVVPWMMTLTTTPDSAHRPDIVRRCLDLVGSGA